MATIQCAGRILAIGLRWAFVSDKAEALKRVRLERARAYVLASGDEGMLLGTAAAKDAPARASSHAAGLLAGHLLRDAIIYEDLGAGRVWVCAVRNGLPLPGMDRLATQEEAAQVVADVRAYAPTPATLVGSHPEAVMTLSALVEQAEPAMLRACRMLVPVDRARVAFYAGLVAAFGVAAYALLQLLNQELPEPTQQVAAQVQQPKVPKMSAEEIRRRDERLLAEGRAAMLRRPDVAVLLPAWREVVRNLPYGIGGYRPRMAECGAKACRLEWDWRAEQFDGSYIHRLPGERVAATSANEYMRRALTNMPMPEIPLRQLDGIRSADFDDWALRLSALVRRTGARIDVVPARQAVTVTLPPLADKQPARTQVIGHEGRASIVLTGWAAIRALLDILSKEQLVAERAVFNINDGNVTLQMETRYVVVPE